jgi:hypothetical protein
MTAHAAPFAAVPGPPIVTVAMDGASGLASAAIALDVVLVVAALVVLVAGYVRRSTTRSRSTVTIADVTVPNVPATRQPLLA